jgi:acyl dehydratase
MLALMTRQDFPFQLVGLVHIGNTIEQDRSVRMDELLDVTVRAENLRLHPRGRAIDVVTFVTADGRVVWRERSTYLHTNRRSASMATATTSTSDRHGSGSPGTAERSTTSSAWTVSRTVGSAYARVSGDWNPIHTSRVAARLFGFRRPIAHGMWTVARCLAAAQPTGPTGYCHIEATFKAPVETPGRVVYSHTTDEDSTVHCRLESAQDNRLHLTLTIAA